MEAVRCAGRARTWKPAPARSIVPWSVNPDVRSCSSMKAETTLEMPVDCTSIRVQVGMIVWEHGKEDMTGMRRRPKRPEELCGRACPWGRRSWRTDGGDKGDKRREEPRRGEQLARGD